MHDASDGQMAGAISGQNVKNIDGLRRRFWAQSESLAIECATTPVRDLTATVSARDALMERDNRCSATSVYS